MFQTVEFNSSDWVFWSVLVIIIEIHTYLYAVYYTIKTRTTHLPHLNIISSYNIYVHVVLYIYTACTCTVHWGMFTMCNVHKYPIIRISRITTKPHPYSLIMYNNIVYHLDWPELYQASSYTKRSTQ